MSIHAGVKSCSDLGRVLVLNDPAARTPSSSAGCARRRGWMTPAAAGGGDCWPWMARPVWSHSAQHPRQCGAIPLDIHVSVVPFHPKITSVWCQARCPTACSATVHRYTLSSFVITSASALSTKAQGKHTHYRALVGGVYVTVVLAVSPPAAAAAARAGGAGAARVPGRPPLHGMPFTSRDEGSTCVG